MPTKPRRPVKKCCCGGSNASVLLHGTRRRGQDLRCPLLLNRLEQGRMHQVDDGLWVRVQKTLTLVDELACANEAKIVARLQCTAGRVPSALQAHGVTHSQTYRLCESQVLNSVRHGQDVKFTIPACAGVVAQHASALLHGAEGCMAHRAHAQARWVVQDTFEVAVVLHVPLGQLTSLATGHAELAACLRGTEIQDLGEQPLLHNGDSGPPCYKPRGARQTQARDTMWARRCKAKQRRNPGKTIKCRYTPRAKMVSVASTVRTADMESHNKQ
jgi:hypothetical protein